MHQRMQSLAHRSSSTAFMDRTKKPMEPTLLQLCSRTHALLLLCSRLLLVLAICCCYSATTRTHARSAATLLTPALLLAICYRYSAANVLTHARFADTPFTPSPGTRHLLLLLCRNCPHARSAATFLLLLQLLCYSSSATATLLLLRTHKTALAASRESCLHTSHSQHLTIPSCY